MLRHQAKSNPKFSLLQYMCVQILIIILKTLISLSFSLYIYIYIFFFFTNMINYYYIIL